MARTVADAFSQFFSWIEPSGSEVTAAKTHRGSIEQGLRGVFANFNRLEIMGSHTRESAIRAYSDVDYLAVIGVADVRWGNTLVSSNTTLAHVRNAMNGRFGATACRQDGPAIVVGFKQGAAAVDVVPGFYRGTTKIDGYPVFAIPDGSGNWIETSPQRHSKYLSEENAVAGGKLAPLIRLLKAWKYSRSPAVPVLGFHLELAIAESGICRGVKTYRECLYDAFRLLRDRRGADLNDPLKLATRIPCSSTPLKALAVVQHAAHGVDHSARALDAEIKGKTAEAFRQWSLVFNGNFPAYG